MAVLLVAAATLFGTALGAGAVIAIGSLGCCQARQVETSYEEYITSLPQREARTVSANDPKTVLNIVPVATKSENQAVTVVEASTTTAAEPVAEVSGLSTVKGWYKDFVDTETGAGSPPNIVVNELAAGVSETEKEFSNLIKALNQQQVVSNATPTKTKKDN